MNLQAIAAGAMGSVHPLIKSQLRLIRCLGSVNERACFWGNVALANQR